METRGRREANDVPEWPLLMAWVVGILTPLPACLGFIALSTLI
jgi:hypothetical protein